MKNLQYVALILALGSTLLAEAASKANIEGSPLKVIELTPDANTGLNTIFVVNDTKGCTIKFEAANGYTANLMKYSNLGGGYAQEVTDADRSATSVAVALSSEDTGFIFEDGGATFYCWIVNYANHQMTLKGVDASDQPDCNYSVLDIDGGASPITFYTINGQPRTLSRDIYVDYTTQEFNNEIPGYVTVDQRKIYESLGSSLSITPPAYSSTYFTVSGDRFLREWGLEVSAESRIVSPYAIECSTEAVQEGSTSDEPSNIMGSDNSGLGGSAPAEISFYAYVTEGVLHYEWQMSRDQEFENPEYRFYQQDLDYTFTEDGTYYLRFVGSNSDGSCDTFGDIYTVSIGASALECPNAFSPNDDGVNDIWKVSYRSLIEFHCEIFNRNGQRIYGFDDPSGGWDGTWNGKKVKPGVYYYVITATGADGHKYKKSGDINIITSKIYSPSSDPNLEF